jgi:hypothetical protein
MTGPACMRQAARQRQGHDPVPQKKGRYTRGVWVALPENTRILRKVTAAPVR